MSLLPCRFEPRILAADRDDPAIAAHLEDCASCRQALHLQTALLELAGHCVPLHPLPSAEELRRCAELAGRLALEPLPAAPSRRRAVLATAGAALLLAALALAPAGALVDLMAVARAAAPATRALLVALLAAAPLALAGTALGLFGEEA